MRTLALTALALCLGTGCTVVHATSVRPVQIAASSELVGGVVAELEEVNPASGAMDLVVSFRNETDAPVRVVRYRVRWSAGTMVTAPEGLEIAAGATIQVVLRVGPDAGDLYALYQAPMRARVDVLEVAPAR
jgi:uncharacterized protein YcfL